MCHSKYVHSKSFQLPLRAFNNCGQFINNGNLKKFDIKLKLKT